MYKQRNNEYGRYNVKSLNIVRRYMQRERENARYSSLFKKISMMENGALMANNYQMDIGFG